MFSIRWRKVIRDLWGNKARTFLVVISIAIGVLAIGMITGSQEVLIKGLRDSWWVVNPPSATLYTWAFDEELLYNVRKLPGVKEADARRSFVLRFKTDPTEEKWRNIQLNTFPDYNDIRILKITGETGVWPPGEGEILIERNSLAWLGVSEGGTIIVETPSGPTRTLRVVGTAHDVSQTAAAWVNQAAGYISIKSLPLLGMDKSFDQLSIIVTGDQTDTEHIKAVAADARHLVERTGREVSFVWLPKPGEHPAEESVTPILMLMGVMGFLSLLLSGFLIVNTLQALLAQQVRQIGIMKAIGGSNGQIMGVYFGMVFAYCLLALLVGVPSGAMGGRWLNSTMVGILNIDVENVLFPPKALAMQVAVGLFVPFLAALYPIIAGVRVSARVAMSNFGSGAGQFGQGLVDRILEHVRGVSRPVLLSLRNTFRRKGRLALTMTTLTLAGAIFIGVFSVQASLLAGVEQMFRYIDYDVAVGFRRGYRAEQIEQEALKVPGVTAAEGWRFSSGRRIRPDGTESEGINIQAPRENSSLVRPIVTEGRWLTPGDENAAVINAYLLNDEPDLKVGDDIVLKMGEQEYTWHIVGLLNGTPPQPLIYVPMEYLSRIEGGLGRAGVVFIQTDKHDSATQNAVAKTVEQHYKDIGFQANYTQTSNSERETINARFAILIQMLLVMAVLLAVVGGIGLMGTMSLNVLERTREIGVMRAIGASDGSVLKIVIIEGLLIGWLSWLLGGLLALPLGKVLSDQLAQATFRGTTPYIYATGGLLQWLLVVTVLAALASAWPARNASRVTVRDVLAYE